MDLYILLIIFLFSFILTFLIYKLALKKSIFDNPNERSSHTIPTPRGGGLAIVITFYLGISYLFLSGKVDNRLYYALLSGIPLLVISIFDDIINLSPKIRFFTQFISGTLALYFLGGLQMVDIGFIQIKCIWILSIISIFGMIWFINLYNFIDGIDGYASMEAIFVGGSLYCLTKNEIALLVAITTLGFLPWNWQRARIFMGDVGSTLLGFILIVLGIYFQNKGEFSLINWLILTSLFWFDATSTLYRRWRNKEKLSVAHRKHAYQRIVQAGSSHQKTVIYAIFINLFLLISVFLAIKFPKLMVGILIIDTFLLYSVVKLIDKKKPFKEA